MKNFNLYLYALTDSKYKSLPVERQVELAIKGGATFVQLREKNISFEEYCRKGVLVKKVCDSYGVPFVINDNVEVAKAIDCTGVHVGQSDMELKSARAVLGQDKIIGVSANTVEEAVKAEAGGADYIGVGAIFYSGTKTDVDVVGTKRLADIVSKVHIPVVAIGGIGRDNCHLIADTGADGIAVVSAVFGAKDIQQAARELLDWKTT